MSIRPEKAKAGVKMVVKMGRKTGSKESREHRAEKHADVLRYLRKGCSIRDTAKLCNVGISTVQRVKKAFIL